jgi:hypothetical protein
MTVIWDVVLVAWCFGTSVSEDLAAVIFGVTCLQNNRISSQEANLIFTSHLKFLVSFFSCGRYSS